MSVASSVVDANDGRPGLMIKLGLLIGHSNKQSTLKSDLQRISYSNYKSSELVKKQRKVRHAIKKGYSSNKDYEAAMFQSHLLYLFSDIFIMFFCADALVEIPDNHVLNLEC